ncbi:hypothetical protein BU15DRAFT_42833, partial [Melanogaster broomeanus]
INVALVGTTGVGKSTLVNVLKGSKIAETSNDAEPRTSEPARYEVEGAGICIWDTRGLDEASEGAAKSALKGFLRFFRIIPDADHELKNFLCGKQPEINLVLFCMERSKIEVEAHWKTYNKIRVDFCKKGITVGVVVTRMDDAEIHDQGSMWKSKCRSTAQRVVKKLLVPDLNLIEAVPKFTELEDEEVKDCKKRILKLILSTHG